MKNKNNMYCENRLKQLRNELYRLIEEERLDSSSVQELSREIDAMILLYYKQDRGIESKTS